MSDIEKRFKEQQIVIRAAQSVNYLGEVLEALTDLAALMIEAGKTSEAAVVIIFIRNHPDVPAETFDRADDLYIDLEARLCPRVMEDARLSAVYKTLDSIITTAFAAFEP